MSVEAELLDAYAQWKRLALAARKAIARRQWAFLMNCQTTIQQLQTRINSLDLRLAEKCRLQGVNLAEYKKNLVKPVVQELIQLLESNKLSLQAVRSSLLEQRSHLDRATTNLRRLHVSYASSRPAGWSRFS